MDSKLLALNHRKQYITVPHSDAGAATAVGFLEETSPGEDCSVYRLDYYEDKHGDTMPRSTKVWSGKVD
jgi:hypothetical protein